MKILPTIAILFFLSSCQSLEFQADNDPGSAVPANTPSFSQLEKLSKLAGKVLLPEITQVGQFMLRRSSEIRDEKGWAMPPYTLAEIKMRFDVEPQVGDRVTVIPLIAKLEPFRRAVANVTKVNNEGCPVPSEKNFYWSADLELITDTEVLEIRPTEAHENETAFSVFTVYPAVPFAKHLEDSSFSIDNLPKSVLVKNVSSAIDLDNDSMPDLISVWFCCGEPEKVSAEKCPYLCLKYYRKVGGVWEFFDINDSVEIC